MSDQPIRLYSTSEAARYLGLSLAAVKYHIHTAKTLTPDYIIGKTFAFTESTLDLFNENRRPPGRPKSEETFE